jgi:hypothetical protein
MMQVFPLFVQEGETIEAQNFYRPTLLTAYTACA